MPLIRGALPVEADRPSTTVTARRASSSTRKATIQRTIVVIEIVGAKSRTVRLYARAEGAIALFARIERRVWRNHDTSPLATTQPLRAGPAGDGLPTTVTRDATLKIPRRARFRHTDLFTVANAAPFAGSALQPAMAAILAVAQHLDALVSALLREVGAVLFLPLPRCRACVCLREAQRTDCGRHQHFTPGRLPLAKDPSKSINRTSRHGASS